MTACSRGAAGARKRPAVLSGEGSVTDEDVRAFEWAAGARGSGPDFGTTPFQSDIIG